jgi:plasmid stability protein
MSRNRTEQLLVRKLPVGLKRKLKQRAARYGLSMEEMARDLLADALKEEPPTKGLGTRIAERFKGIELEEDIPELRGFTIELPKFD